MTVTSTDTRISYAGNDTTVVFAVPFRVIEENDLILVVQDDITEVETTLTYGVDYTVIISGETATVTTISAVATNTTLTISRQTDTNQTVEYVNYQSFPAEVHEEALDKITCKLQEIDYSLGLKLEEADIGTTYQPISEKAQPNGYASLNAFGKVPEEQIPGSINEVQQYADLASFPATGVSATIYLAEDSNMTYRWSGSSYIAISSGAIPWGDIVGVLANQTDLQSALDAKQDTLTIDTVPTNGSTNPIDSNAVYDGLLLKEDVANKVVAFQATPDNTHYPSEKLVKDSLDLKYNSANFVSDFNTRFATKTTDNLTEGSFKKYDKTVTFTGGVNLTIVGSYPDFTINDVTISNDWENTTFATGNDGIIFKNSIPFLHDFNYGDNGTVITDGNNTFLGAYAGNLTMGSTATETYHASLISAFGASSLFSNTTGFHNSAFGVSSLYLNEDGYHNSAFGVSSLYSNISGYYNSGFGNNSLYSNTTGYYNSAIGESSLAGITTGYENIAVGFNAGKFITDGTTPNETSNTSIYLGVNTKASADGNSNEIVIGYNLYGNGSNTTTIGNSSTTATYLAGQLHLENYNFPVADGTNGQFLVTNGSGVLSFTDSISDHGGLTGLSDDDHSQYLLLAGRTGQQITDDLTLVGSFIFGLDDLDGYTTLNQTAKKLQVSLPSDNGTNFFQILNQTGDAIFSIASDGTVQSELTYGFEFIDPFTLADKLYFNTDHDIYLTTNDGDNCFIAFGTTGILNIDFQGDNTGASGFRLTNSDDATIFRAESDGHTEIIKNITTADIGLNIQDYSLQGGSPTGQSMLIETYTDRTMLRLDSVIQAGSPMIYAVNSTNSVRRPDLAPTFVGQADYFWAGSLDIATPFYKWLYTGEELWLGNLTWKMSHNGAGLNPAYNFRTYNANTADFRFQNPTGYIDIKKFTNGANDGMEIASSSGITGGIKINSAYGDLILSSSTSVYLNSSVKINGSAETSSLSVKGAGNNSATYTAKFDNSDGTKGLYVRDDGRVEFRNYSFPVADGSAGQFLITDGAGSLSFTSPSYAEMYQINNSTATTINTVNVWEEINNYSSGEISGITFSASDLTIGTGGAGKYNVAASISGIPTAVNKTFEFAFSVNNTIASKTTQKRLFASSTDTGSVSLHGILDLADSDVVKVEIRNITDDSDFTVQNSNVTVHRIL